MKTLNSYVAFGLSGALALLGGCTTTDTTADGGVDDASSTTPDTSVGDETTDAPMSADGASCGAFSTGMPTCDACIQAMCCTPAATCDTPDDAGVDDAGFTTCENLVSCVEVDCADGGFLSDCEMKCNPMYTAAEQANADALLTCVSTSCAAQCM